MSVATPFALDLPGPSRRIVVEPLRLPQPVTAPPPEPAREAPERTAPEPSRVPEEEPVGV